MTITLAAVYTPVAIQGGLTGALFREFAFTLAGAVIVSGVVALTLSPMMGSKLLRAGDTEQGFAGWINRRFDAVRAAYTARARRARCATGRSCSRCGRSWSLLIVPFYMFSQQELAPDEDQGVVFGIVQAAPNSTLDQTKLFTDAGLRRLPLVPGDGQHLPDHVRRPAASAAWSRSRGASGRRRPSSSCMEATGKLSEIPGIRVIPMTPAAAAGRRRLPGGLRDRLHRRAASSSRTSRTSSWGRPSRAACSCTRTPT